MAELKLQRHISPQCTSEITACGALSSYEQEYKNIQALDTLKDYRLYLVPHVRTKKKQQSCLQTKKAQKWETKRHKEAVCKLTSNSCLWVLPVLTVMLLNLLTDASMASYSQNNYIYVYI